MLHILHLGVEFLFGVVMDQEILSFCFVSSFAATVTISRILSLQSSTSHSHQGI